MNARLKAKILKRGSLIERKKSVGDETRFLLISGNSPEAAEQKRMFDLHKNSSGLSPLVQDLQSVKGTSSIVQNCFTTTRASSEGKRKPKSRESCSYPHIPATVSDDVKSWLPSPLPMRRRNAICDEIEKRTVAVSGRTLRQKRVDMLRSIALTQFALL